MKDKLERYFISRVLPSTTTAYKVDIKDINTFQTKQGLKVACTILADFLFTLPCCPDSEEHERLEDRFSFTLDATGDITECNLVKDTLMSTSL